MSDDNIALALILMMLLAGSAGCERKCRTCDDTGKHPANWYDPDSIYVDCEFCDTVSDGRASR